MKQMIQIILITNYLTFWFLYKFLRIANAMLRKRHKLSCETLGCGKKIVAVRQFSNWYKRQNIEYYKSTGYRQLLIGFNNLYQLFR